MKTKKLHFLIAILMVFSITTISAQRGTCNASTTMYTVIGGKTISDATTALSSTIDNAAVGGDVIAACKDPYTDWGSVTSWSLAVSSDNGEPNITIDSSNNTGAAWEPTIPAAYFTVGAVTTAALTITPDATGDANGCTIPWTYTWTYNLASAPPTFRSDCTGITDMYYVIDGVETHDTTDALAATINDVPVGGIIKVGSNPYIDQTANVASFSIAVSSDNGASPITIDNSNIGSYGQAWQPTIPAAFFTAGATTTVAFTVTPGTNIPSGCTQPWTYTYTFNTATACIPGTYNAYSNLADGEGSSWVNHPTGDTTINLYSVPSAPIYLGVDPKTSSPQVEWNGCGQTAVATAELYFTPTFDASGTCTVTGNFTNNCGDLVVYTFNLNQAALGIETFEKAGFSMYPNPAKNNLNIKFNGDLDVVILNTSGQKLISRSIKGQETIDVSHLSSGIYFVKLAAGKDVMTRKFIKN